MFKRHLAAFILCLALALGLAPGLALAFEGNSAVGPTSPKAQSAIEAQEQEQSWYLRPFNPDPEIEPGMDTTDVVADIVYLGYYGGDHKPQIFSYDWYEYERTGIGEGNIGKRLMIRRE